MVQEYFYYLIKVHLKISLKNTHPKSLRASPTQGVSQDANAYNRYIAPCKV